MSLPPPPHGTDLSEDRRPEVITVSVLVSSLAIFSVVLRIVSRRIMGVRIWLDDWLIIASLAGSCGMSATLGGFAVSQGLGRHIWVAVPDIAKTFSISLFASELFYFSSLLFTKLSILAFYWKTFKVCRSIRIQILVLGVIIILSGGGSFLVTLLQCWPICAWWERYDLHHPMLPSQYSCTVNPVKFWYGYAIPSIITDVLVLALPVPCILNLQLPGMQKAALSGIFLVGFFVTIMSIVRLVCLVKSNLNDPDSTWSFIEVVLWSTAELNIAVVCGKSTLQFLSAFLGGRINEASLMLACLPFFRPILNITARTLHINTPFHSTRNKQPSVVTPQAGHSKEQDCSSLGVHAFAGSAETDEHLSWKNTAPTGAIMVTREIHMDQKSA